MAIEGLGVAPVDTLAFMDDEAVIGVLAIGGLFIVIITAIIARSLQTVMKTRAKEQTRREVAAYVAEGSMSAADAARLLGNDQTDFEKRIADAVAWGMLSPEKAEKLIEAHRRTGDDSWRPRPGCGV